MWWIFRRTETPVRGNMMYVFLSGGSFAELRSFFEKLATDGKVTYPLQEQPFGYYGALNDRFSVRWMFHTDKKD